MAKMTSNNRSNRAKSWKIARIQKVKNPEKRKKLIANLHPVYRPLALGFRKRWIVKRSVATRIRNRTLYYFPLPRVFPWHCEVCTLSSRFYDFIENHPCPKKNASRHIQDFANEKRIAHLGFRSKAKDALAVMERVPNPQAIRLSFASPLDRPKSTPIENVPQLSITTPLSDRLRIALNSKPKAVIVNNFAATNEEYEQVASESVNLLSKDNGNGHICMECRKIFGSYADFDKHLTETECGGKEEPQSIPVETRHSGTIPSSCIYGVRKQKAENKDLAENAKELRFCTLCFKDGFATEHEFHEHLFNCPVREQERQNELLKFWVQKHTQKII
ncbi:hypothetical protein WR25_09093 [Diploscapter pachys]|uniref:Uncharacterized protein n=1 Tax=Diploscapter pachys TaxID=2018661 RepID=A0A2A2LPC8_9BILA|nr:hypothetical protein WR25_09093 [Diploscapter pachys]